MPRNPKTGRWCSQAEFDALVHNKTRVFVFGTLKKGLWNHRLLTHVQGVDAVTKDKYKMQSSGVPFVLAGNDAQVRGEMYEVDDKTLLSLDYLEGYDPGRHGKCAYNRTLIDVLVGPGFTETVQAYIYLSNRERMGLDYKIKDADGYLNWQPIRHVQPAFSDDDEEEEQDA